jgi:hypothetical protein
MADTKEHQELLDKLEPLLSPEVHALVSSELKPADPNYKNNVNQNNNKAAERGTVGTA